MEQPPFHALSLSHLKAADAAPSWSGVKSHPKSHLIFSFRMAAVTAFPGCAGLARLPCCSSLPSQEETAEG